MATVPISLGPSRASTRKLAHAARVAGSKAPFDPSTPNSIDTLEIVYKAVERCNINCTYCYYFNMGDDTALDRPAIASTDTVANLARWIAQGCRQQMIPRATIAFHGGEPMIMGPARFREMCDAFRAAIDPVADLSFSIQTNATILNDEWLDAFREHRVGIGVSIDGDQAAHDRYRLDRHGRSTFTATNLNLQRLMAWADGDPALRPSTISVMSRGNDYRQVYAFLRNHGVERMGFLLPDRNADDEIGSSQDGAAGYGRALFEIFEAWMTEDNPDVSIKFIQNALSHLSADGPSRSVVADGRRKKSHQVIIARSDGTVAIDDSYIPALDWYSESPVYSINDSTLGQFLSDPIFRQIEAASAELPTDCQDCEWRSVCRGGDLENRFSAVRGFDNPSIYCAGYKVFYRQMCDTLLDNGFPRALMDQRLSLSASP